MTSRSSTYGEGISGDCRRIAPERRRGSVVGSNDTIMAIAVAA
ncbi:hypothetical protein [Tardiphaga sp.]|nr:hypothetical protein [Tardiphaga sp.]